MDSWWPLITALFQVVQAAGLVVGGLYTALKIQRTASAGATLMSATISGLQAANAVLGRSRNYRIAGPLVD